jgi:hypothetical protein
LFAPNTFLEVVESALLAVLCLAIIYAIWMLRQEIGRARVALETLRDQQKVMNQSVGALRLRLDAVEAARTVRESRGADQVARLIRVIDAIDGALAP